MRSTMSEQLSVQGVEVGAITPSELDTLIESFNFEDVVDSAREHPNLTGVLITRLLITLREAGAGAKTEPEKLREALMSLAYARDYMSAGDEFVVCLHTKDDIRAARNALGAFTGKDGRDG